MAKGELIDPVVPQPGKRVVRQPAYTDQFLDENAKNQQQRDFYNSDEYKRGLQFMDNFVRPSGPTRSLSRPGAALESHKQLLNSDLTKGKESTNVANSNLRRGLLDAVSARPAELREEQRLLHNEAGDTLTQGLKNTRQNYNSRGMLYSGLRQAGEQSLRNQVASTLASNQVSAARDSDKLTDAYKQQIASIGLKAGKEATAKAEATFEAKMRSDIARRQAIQQLGEGVGYGLGALYGNSADGDTGIEPEQKRFYGTRQYLSPEDY